jgi:hypothetical protein
LLAEGFYLFGAELMAAEHAVVAHLGVKVHLASLASGTGYVFILRLEHLLVAFLLDLNSLS